MSRTHLFLAGALAMALTLSGTSAFAQVGEPRNQITYFTFSAPFELPGGKTLPAGKYAFELVDSPSNRHIVKIMSEDQKTMYDIVMAIPAQRMEPSDEPEIRFMEAPADQPPAIRTWFYPGRVIGHEFIYPKDQARRLAANQNEGVLTTAGNAEDMKTADLARIDREGHETPYNANAAANGENASAEQANTQRANQTAENTAAAEAANGNTRPEMANEPERSSQQTARAEANREDQPESRMAMADRDNARTELPQTAGPLPLFLLAGLGSLAGAGALRFRR